MMNKVCPSCGRKYSELEAYCTKCGLELEKAPNTCSGMKSAMSLSEIEKKIEGKEIKSIEDARKYLTDEELVYYLNNDVFYGVRADIFEEDVCAVAEILRILGGKGYSVAHTSRILSACKAFAERIAQFRF